MPMMNSEARKRAASGEAAPDQLAMVLRLAESWDREADTEEARGNGFAAVILHAHADELRNALGSQLSA
jgi:hypothetical protein